MSKALRLDGDTCQTLRRAALVHDIGKIFVPEALFRRESTLSAEELEVLRAHPVTGERVLRAIPTLAPLALFARHHHERCDGSGFPDGLAGDDIPLPTHVLIVANVFDVMTSDRSFRKAMSLHDALEKLRADAGASFDQRAVQALLGLDRGLLSAANDRFDSRSMVKGRATASVSVRK
jgi:HD-GYP domain-containing protein (c-di-GMP phosphodiesterase class II)